MRAVLFIFLKYLKNILIYFFRYKKMLDEKSMKTYCNNHLSNIQFCIRVEYLIKNVRNKRKILL